MIVVVAGVKVAIIGDALHCMMNVSFPSGVASLVAVIVKHCVDELEPNEST